MSTLRFKYSTLDLKFDVEKVKTKKDPQEMVDNINCKLTRLATWRDILVNVSDGPDFFSNESKYGSHYLYLCSTVHVVLLCIVTCCCHCQWIGQRK
jgi:hypothetical protein